MPASVVWFRQDLRLRDHPALRAAARPGVPIVPLFIWSADLTARWTPGAASRWWLHHSLAALQRELRSRGLRLVIRCGPAARELGSVVQATGADAVFWSETCEPVQRAQDAEISESLAADGVRSTALPSNLLFDPQTIRTRGGDPYRVFTPFWNACQEQTVPLPLGLPRRWAAPQRWPASLQLEDLDLLPRVDWAAGLRDCWTPGEAGARQRLESFLRRGVASYEADRDRPDRPHTSRLSPHLHFGEISVRQVWHAVRRRAARGARDRALHEGAQAFLRQLAWREFAYHLLVHFPYTSDEPLRREFASFPWRRSPAQLRAWQRGRTGFPIVDAGMRELWGTGWMHNRVRMIVASFLVKDLLLPWLDGARWFWDTLVDADLANNTLGWQWTAGCGADAAPFFRIFNPVGQGEKFDPRGRYVRRWVPELARLPNEWVQRPWQAPAAVLETAGIRLGATYPRPILDHAMARARALAGLARMSHRGR